MLFRSGLSGVVHPAQAQADGIRAGSGAALFSLQLLPPVNAGRIQFFALPVRHGRGGADVVKIHLVGAAAGYGNIFRADYIDRIGKFRFPFAAARIGDRGAVDHVIGPDLTEQRQEPGGVTDVRRTA